MRRNELLSGFVCLAFASSTIAQEDEGPNRDLGERSVRLYLAHMIFMILAWLLLVPSAILIARFGRSYFNWFPHHRNIQILTLIFITIGLALGIAAMFAEGASQWTENHHKVGISIFILAWLQAMLGLAAHTAKVRYLRFIHIPIGLLLFGLAIWNIQTGFDLWGWEAGVAPKIFVYVWMGVLIAIYAAGLLLLPKQIKQDKARMQDEKLGRDEKVSPVSSLNRTSHGTAMQSTDAEAQNANHKVAGAGAAPAMNNRPL